MKKIIYCIAILGTVFIGCNPMEDIYKDIDAVERPIIGEDAYTLISEDYDDLNLPFGSFNSENDAKTMLPPFLSEKYPYWGEGSSVNVGYQLYIGNAFDLRDYNLDQDDYTFSGSSGLGFEADANPGDYLTDILADNISSAKEGDYRRAKYYQYTGDFVIVTPTVSLDENFDYGATDGDLTTVSGGVWTAHSGGGDGPTGYSTSGLSMADYPSSGIGGSSTIEASGAEDVNSAFPEISSGNVYFSGLVNLSAVSTDGNYFFYVKDDGFNYSGRVGAKDDGSGKILFGIGASSSTLTYGTTAFDLNTTYLIVATYNIDTGVSNLHVLSTVEETEPTTPEATNTGSSGRLVSTVAYRQASGATNSTPTGTIDGVRVANTWSAIMSNELLDDEIIGDKTAGEMYYVYTGEAWEIPTDGFYAITEEDFASMGIETFGSDTPAEDYLPTFLGLKYPYAQEEDELDLGYNYVSSSSGPQSRGNLYTVVDGEWTPHMSVISTSLQFGHDGNTWVPDNTLRYNLTGADIAFISNAFINIYPGPAANVLQFGSFDRRSSSSNYWSDEMLLEAFNALLENGNFVTAEEQKYVLTYIVYTGATGPETKFVIKTGGTWIYQ